VDDKALVCGLEPERSVALLGERGWVADVERATMQKILAESTDWRFVHEITRELKG